MVEGTSAAGHRRPHRRIRAPGGRAGATRSISGCVNLTGLLPVRVTKAVRGVHRGQASWSWWRTPASKKARAENFITALRPLLHACVCVVIAAAAGRASRPLLLGLMHLDRLGLAAASIFLVVSCPCALVISVPLSFFGGIGGASRAGHPGRRAATTWKRLPTSETVVFDKTGTLTERLPSTWSPSTPANARTRTAAGAGGSMRRAYSDHPICSSPCSRPTAARIDASRVMRRGGDRGPRRAGPAWTAARWSWATTSSWRACGVDCARLRPWSGTIAPRGRRTADTWATSSSPTRCKEDAGRGHRRTCTRPWREPQDCHAHRRHARTVAAAVAARAGPGRVPRPASARRTRWSGWRRLLRRQGRQGKAGLRGRRHQRRARAHAGRTWASPWAPWAPTPPSRPPMWCSWTTSPPTSPGAIRICTQDAWASCVQNIVFALGVKLLVLVPGRPGHGQHVDGGLCRRGRGRHRHSERDARDEGA